MASQPEQPTLVMFHRQSFLMTRQVTPSRLHYGLKKLTYKPGRIVSAKWTASSSSIGTIWAANVEINKVTTLSFIYKKYLN